MVVVYRPAEVGLNPVGPQQSFKRDSNPYNFNGQLTVYNSKECTVSNQITSHQVNGSRYFFLFHGVCPGANIPLLQRPLERTLEFFSEHTLERRPLWRTLDCGASSEELA